MEDPASYDANSHAQRRDAQEILPSIISKMSWKDSEVVLDFGSGIGFTTKNILKPLVDRVIPHSTIYGMDISSKLVEYASANNASSDIFYSTTDILKDDLEIPIKFDKIFSTFVLHWIHDQKKVFAQLHKMLKLGGEIGLIYLTSSTGFKLYEIMANSPKWATFLVDTQFIPPPTQHDVDPIQTTRKNMEEAGYTVNECTLSPRIYKFDSLDAAMDVFQSVDPNIGKIPEEMLSEYKNDFRNEVKKCVSHARPLELENFEFENVYIIIRAQKVACACIKN